MMLVGLPQAQALLVLVMLPFTWTASIAVSGVSDVSDSETSMMADIFDSPQEGDVQADHRHRRGLEPGGARGSDGGDDQAGGKGEVAGVDKSDSDWDMNGETRDTCPKLQETNFVWKMSGFSEKLAAAKDDPKSVVSSEEFSIGDGYTLRAAAYLNGTGGDEQISILLQGKGMCQAKGTWIQEVGSKFEFTIFLMDPKPGRQKHVARDLFPYVFRRPSPGVPANTKIDNFILVHKFLGFYPLASLEESGYVVDGRLVFKVVARPAKTADDFQPLDQEISSCSDVNLKWTMTSFKQKQELAADGGPRYIFSPTFPYENYKLILRVFPNGFKKGTNTHLSVSIHVMNDKYDPHVPWPLPSYITIKLLKKNHGHQGKPFSKTLTADTIKEVMSWPQPNAIMSPSLDVTDFISFEDLESPSHGYLDEFVDSLTFEVVAGPPLDTDTVSTNGVFEWKISDFSHKKEEAMSREQLAIYSPAFYSAKGYKFTASASLNGHGPGYNTHMSVNVFVMAGERDAHLTWPFRGRVTFMVFDHKKDKPVHWFQGFRVDGTDALQKPAEGAFMNVIRRGSRTFFPLDRLSLSTSDYIVKDTLTLKVVVQPPLSKDTFQDLVSEDGTLVWPIEAFTRKQQSDAGAQSFEIHSPAFSTGQHKLALFLYPNGYGNGTASHLSIYLSTVFDKSGHLNTRPFQGKVNITVVHPTGSEHNVKVSDDNLELQTPEEGAVVGRVKGFPQVLPLADLREKGFLSCDKLTIKVSVRSHEAEEEPELQ